MLTNVKLNIKFLKFYKVQNTNYNNTFLIINNLTKYKMFKKLIIK